MESRYSRLFSDLEKRLTSEHDVALTTMTSTWSETDKTDLEAALRLTKTQFEKEIADLEEERRTNEQSVEVEGDDRELLLQRISGRMTWEILAFSLVWNMEKDSAGYL